MAETGALHDAFIDELRDTSDAEKQLTKALPKLAKAATNPKLRAAPTPAHSRGSWMQRRTMPSDPSLTPISSSLP